MAMGKNALHNIVIKKREKRVDFGKKGCYIGNVPFPQH